MLFQYFRTSDSLFHKLKYFCAGKKKWTFSKMCHQSAPKNVMQLIAYVAINISVFMTWRTMTFKM